MGSILTATNSRNFAKPLRCTIHNQMVMWKEQMGQYLQASKNASSTKKGELG
jgi:hypothetical protein